MDTVLGNIFVATITGGMALVGVIISNITNSHVLGSKVTQQLEIAQAVTNEKIDSLKEEVKKHNNFAERIPIIETEMKSFDRRLSGLEEIERDRSL